MQWLQSLHFGDFEKCLKIFSLVRWDVQFFHHISPPQHTPLVVINDCSLMTTLCDMSVFTDPSQVGEIEASHGGLVLCPGYVLSYV